MYEKIIATFVAVLIAGLLLAGCGGERQTDETSQVWELPKISSGKAVFYQNGGQVTKLSLNQNEMSSLEKRVRDTLASMERPLWVSLAVTPEQMSDYYKQGREFGNLFFQHTEVFCWRREWGSEGVRPAIHPRGSGVAFLRKKW